MNTKLAVSRPGCVLAGDVWPGGKPLIVLLHEGVADRRGWTELAGYLAPSLTVVTYDRRGYGETPVSPEPFSHVDDLLAVLDEVANEPVWLLGASAGGGLALDTAIVAPDRVAGLVLLGSAISGAPEPEVLDPDLQRLEAPYEAAIAAGDLAELNRLTTWVWLDGPAQPEGRVAGPARQLALAMNEVILRNAAPEDAGASGVDAWNRLDEVRAPVTIACGDLDVPFLIAGNRELARRLPGASYHVLPGMAHQPYLEHPGQVASLIQRALAAS
jgi:pimeloyl-ACP methyl ester carboxylesterase